MKQITLILCIVFVSKLFCQSDFWEKKFEIESIIESIAFDSHDNIYIGIEDKGIFKSSDGGNTWENKSSGLTLNSIRCITVNENDELFCGVSYNGGGLRIVGSKPLGVFRSTDYGNSWELVYESIWVKSIVIDSDDHIYACCNTYNLVTDVVVSEDNGNTWKKIEVGLPEEFVTEMTMDEKENLYITRFEGGLYKSTNKGSEWFLIENEFKGKWFIKIVSDSNGLLIAKIDSVGLFKSINEGDTWEKINYMGDEIYLHFFPSEDGDIFLTSSDIGLQYLEQNKSKWEILTPNLERRITSIITIDKYGFMFVSMIIRSEDIFPEVIGSELYKSRKPVLK